MREPRATPPNPCAILLDACDAIRDWLGDISIQALRQPEDRTEVLKKVDGLIEALCETRKKYVEALPPTT